MARFGYYADLRGVTFSETKQWIQAMRVGEYQHPAYGKINLSMDRIRRFADSVKSRVRGIELDIDYDHKTDPARGNEAAGWVKDAKVEGDALYLLVDWTKTALEKIKEGAYRYFSPEFQDDWTDATGTVHQDVLFGGGITNRPFLKDLLPINLSELTFAEQKEGRRMDPKALRKLLGLPEDAKDEQVLERIEQNQKAAQSKGNTPPDGLATTHAPNTGATTNPGGTIDGKPYDATTATGVDKDGKALSPEEIQLNELSRTNPAMAFLLREQMKTNKALSEQIAQLTEANKLSEIRVKLNEYQTGQTVIAPAVLDEASKLLAKAPVALHAEIHNVLKLVQGGKGTVQLGEVGSTGHTSARTDGKSATDLFEEAIQTQRKKFSEASGGKELSYSDALIDVAASNPELYARYREESYAFKI